jgi:hypothetical protein
MAISACDTPTEPPFFMRIFVTLRTVMILDFERSRGERGVLSCKLVAL